MVFVLIVWYLKSLTIKLSWFCCLSVIQDTKLNLAQLSHLWSYDHMALYKCVYYYYYYYLSFALRFHQCSAIESRLCWTRQQVETVSPATVSPLLRHSWLTGVVNRDVLQPSNDVVKAMIYGCTTLTFNRHWLSFLWWSGAAKFLFA